MIQDPGDPVTVARFAREVAAANPAMTLWEAPAVANDDPRFAWKGRWGSHVAAFAAHPVATMAVIDAFIRSTLAPSLTPQASVAGPRSLRDASAP